TKFNTDGTTEDNDYGYNPHTDVETLTDDKGDTRSTYGYTAYGQNDDKEFTGVDKPTATDPTKEPYNAYRFNSARWDHNSGNYDGVGCRLDGLECDHHLGVGPQGRDRRRRGRHRGRPRLRGRHRRRRIARLRGARRRRRQHGHLRDEDPVRPVDRGRVPHLR